MCVAGALKTFTSLLLHYGEGSSDGRCKEIKLLRVFHFILNMSRALADNVTEALLFFSHFIRDRITYFIHYLIYIYTLYLTNVR